MDKAAVDKAAVDKVTPVVEEDPMAVEEDTTSNNKVAEVAAGRRITSPPTFLRLTRR